MKAYADESESSAAAFDAKTQLSGASHTSNSISHIAKLPPELHLRILAKVPARDIQKCRRLDQYFRSLIDNKRNHSLCTGPGISRSLKRLEKQAVEFSNFPTDTVDVNGMPTGFLNAFVHFVKFHGLCLAEDEKVYRHTLAFFALHWYLLWHQISYHTLRKVSQEELDIVADLFACAWTIVRQYVKVHGSDTPGNPEAVRAATLCLEEAFTPSVRELIGINTDTQMKLFIDEILLPSRAFLGEPIHEHYAPKQIEETVLYLRPGHKSSSRAIILYNLSRLLGIPTLPWCTPAGLFVTSDRAVEEVKMIMEKRKPCGHVKRAALLEEMFITWDPQIGEVMTFSEETAGDQATND